MHKTALIALLLVVAACSQKPAQIVMHGSQPTKRPQPQVNSDAPFTPVFGSVKQSQPAPVKDITVRELDAPNSVMPNQIRRDSSMKPQSSLIRQSGQVSEHLITVKPDDSLYTIARRYGIPAKDIVEANHLKAPYDLSRTRTLKMPGQENTVAEAQMPVLEKPLENIPQTAINTLSAPTPRLKPEVVSLQAEDQGPVAFKPFSVKPHLDRKGQFIWPVAGRMISRFGPKSGGQHNDGVNIAADEGSPVYASMDGTVVYTGKDLPSYGNLLIIRHENGWLTAYAHAKEILVSKGDKVKLGQPVASVGQTGNVKSPQLYFGIRDGKKPLDPVRKVVG